MIEPRAAKPHSGKPIRCLVIQMARLGDTLQSLMALRAAKQLYPQLEIHFLAHSRYIAAAQRVPWIERTIPFPTDLLIGDAVSGKASVEDALPGVARWISPLVKEEWDFVINWSYSESSSFLCALIPAEAKLGYSRRKDLSIACSDEWSCYIQGIIQGQARQNIHLTDILTTQLLTALQLRYGEPTAAGNEPVTSKGFFALELDDSEWSWASRHSGRRWVGIQLGAGKNSKTWSPESWARFVDLLVERHPDVSIALLGGASDVTRATRFKKAMKNRTALESRVLSLVGKTEFDLWASIVGRCQWIVAADTAVIHLASVLGTRVMNLSLGPAKWQETGPYGNQHYVLMPATEGRDGSDLSPEAVYAAWSYANLEWSQHRGAGAIGGAVGIKKHPDLSEHFTALGFGAFLHKIRVLRSRIRPTGDGGGVVYESVLKRPALLDDWLSIVTGQIARAWYCGWVAPVGHELSREGFFDIGLLRELRALGEGVQSLIKLLDQARYSATLLSARSSALKSDRVMRLSDREAIAELGGKIKEIDALIERVGEIQGPLKPFSDMIKVMMHNLQGEDLPSISKESVDVYARVADGARLFKDWLEYSLKLARPRPVIAREAAPRAANP